MSGTAAVCIDTATMVSTDYHISRARSSTTWRPLQLLLVASAVSVAMLFSTLSVCFTLADAHDAVSVSNSHEDMVEPSSNGRLLLHSNALHQYDSNGVLDRDDTNKRFQEALLVDSGSAMGFALSADENSVQRAPGRSLLRKRKRDSDEEEEEDEDEGDEDEEEDEEDEDEDEEDEEDDDDDDDQKPKSKKKKKSKKKNKSSKSLLGVQLDMTVLQEHEVGDEEDDGRRRRRLLAAAKAAAAGSDPGPSTELGGYVVISASKFPDKTIVLIGTLPREEAEKGCTSLATSGKPGFSIDLKKMKQKDGVDDGDDITSVTIEHHINCLVADKTGKMGANEKLKTVVFVLIVQCESKTVAVDCPAGATTCNVYSTKSVIPAASDGKAAAGQTATAGTSQPAAGPAAGPAGAAKKPEGSAAGAGAKPAAAGGRRKLTAAYNTNTPIKDLVLNGKQTGTTVNGKPDKKQDSDDMLQGLVAVGAAKEVMQAASAAEKGTRSVVASEGMASDGTYFADYAHPDVGGIALQAKPGPKAGEIEVTFQLWKYNDRSVPPVRSVVTATFKPEKVPGGRCFPAAAQVTLANGTKAPMHEVRHGDLVLTVLPSGNLGFSEVYLFGHKDPEALSHFVALQTDDNSSTTLLASPDHYIHIIPQSKAAAAAQLSWRDVVHTRAGKVKPGDVMVHVSWEASCRSVSQEGAVGPSNEDGADCGSMSYVTITSVKTQISRGLYNPYTMVGNIVVDGYSTSSHSGLDFLDPLTGTGPYVPYLHQAMLSPVRLIHRLYPTLLTYVDQQYSKDAWEYAGVVNVVRSIAQFHTRQM